MKLTKRLEAVLSLCPRARVIADVGTDHGYLAVALIQRNLAKKVIAIDVHKEPLASAKRYVKASLLENQIDCRLGDGLTVTEAGDLDGAILCGMGGFLMRDIIASGPELLNFYLLQPQNGQAELRKYMLNQGYALTKEILIKDMGKYYTAFLAQRKGTFEEACNYNGKDSNTYYHELSEDSVQWGIGGLVALESSLLKKEYLTFLIKQKQNIYQGLLQSNNASQILSLKREIEELMLLRDEK